LSTLIFGGDKVNSWDKAAPEPATLKVGMTEADFSSKNLGPAGAIIISAWISHKDKGALTSLNISNNGLSRGAHDGSTFYDDDYHFTTDTTGNCSSAGTSSHTTDIAGIIALASAIKDMGALSSLNLASNNLGGYNVFTGKYDPSGAL
jgi:hypothetical protein